MHFIVSLALYNICGFSLKYNMLFLAVIAGFLFLVSAWIGMFVAITKMTIMVLET